MATSITIKAQKYVKPEKRYLSPAERHSAPTILQSNSPILQSIDSQRLSSPDTKKKKEEKELDTHIIEESDADESSDQSSEDADDDGEGKVSNGSPTADKSQKKNQNQLPSTVLSHLSSLIHPALKKSESAADPQQVRRSGSVIGRHRHSTFDPSTLRRLKDIKLETMKQDDQIEVNFL